MSLPAAFDYHPAKTVDEAIALLQQYGDDAKLLAGGHSLLPTMKLRLAQPGHLIDIGTIGGSIAHSDPAADMPGIVLALRADMLVQGASGVRTIKADDFFKGLFETDLQPDEIITEIRFAIPPAHS